MWVLYALLAAGSSAAARTFMKSAADAADDRTIVFWRYAGASLPALLMLLVVGIPEVEPEFVPAVLTACISDVGALLLMSRALRSTGMGKAVPLLSLTPIFLLGTGLLILGEVPTIWGGVGVLIIVVGAYLLRLERGIGSLLTPFKLLLQDPGARYMMGTALLFSLTGPFFKKSIMHSGPFFSMAVSLPLSGLILWFVHVASGGSTRKLMPTDLGPVRTVGLGFTMFGVALFVNLGLVTGLVSYVISIKRLSILMGIVIGGVMFGERSVVKNLAAGAVMIAGAALITLT